VIPEAVSHAALIVMGRDQTITSAAALGTLELNQFLPLIAHLLLGSLTLLTRTCRLFTERCVDGLAANEENCARYVNSSTATLTALVPLTGYERASEIAEAARKSGCSIRDAALASGLLSADQFRELTSPEALMRLGSAPCPPAKEKP